MGNCPGVRTEKGKHLVAHLIHSLASTAKTVVTLPLNVAKAVTAPALRRVGVLHEDGPRVSEQRSAQPPEPRTPPVRRTAEEAVARELAEEPAAPPAEELKAGPAGSEPGGTERLDDERYDDFDEPPPSGNAAAAPGAGADSGSRKKKQASDEPVLDAAAAKAVRSESETMRKAADPRKQ